MSATIRGAADEPAVAPTPRFRAVRFFYLNNSIGAVVTAAVLVALVAAFWAGPRFYSVDGISNVTSSIALPLLAGSFASLGLLSGVVDLSVGPMIGVSAALFSVLGTHHVNVWIAGLVAVVACVLAASINAVAVVIFGADSIAATVGMLTILTGVTFALIGNNPPSFIVDALFNFSLASVGPFAALFLVAAGCAVALAVVVLFTRVGRHLKAAGGDPAAAMRAGIRVSRLRFGAFLMGGVGAGLTGIFYIGQNGGGAIDIGTNLTFEIFAALMIGGFSVVRGGVGNPIGAIFGLLIIGAVGVLLDISQIDSHYLNVVLGVVLIIAVLVDRLRGGERFE